MSKKGKALEKNKITNDDLMRVHGKSPATTSTYRTAVRLFLGWAESKRKTLIVEALGEYIQHLRNARASPSKVNLALYSMKAAFLQAAAKKGMATREVMMLKTTLDAIPAKKPRLPNVRFVTQAERQRLIRGMSARIALISRFLYASGARVSEVVQIERAKCRESGDAAEIIIEGKSPQKRTIWIPQSLLKEIDTEFRKRARSKKRKYLFETIQGEAYSRIYVTREIRKAALRSLKRTISANDLRHSRAIDLFNKTGNLKAIAELLGHSGVNMITTYHAKHRFTKKELFRGHL
jgi:site-specific recombinase XerD